MTTRTITANGFVIVSAFGGRLAVFRGWPAVRRWRTVDLGRPASILRGTIYKTRADARGVIRTIQQPPLGRRYVHFRPFVDSARIANLADILTDDGERLRADVFPTEIEATK